MIALFGIQRRYASGGRYDERTKAYMVGKRLLGLVKFQATCLIPRPILNPVDLENTDTSTLLVGGDPGTLRNHRPRARIYSVTPPEAVGKSRENAQVLTFRWNRCSGV